MQYKISVIVPVYNGEKYIRECVDSILAQTFKDIEIVLVDDGSKDSSGALCDEYVSKYDNIQTIHQDNSGVTMARKKGVQIANGTWITFVDADDTLPEEAMSTLASRICENTDMIIGCVNKKDLDSNNNLEQCRHNIISGRLIPALWGKLIRKKIISDFIFDIPRDIRKGEDQLANIRLLFASDKMPVLIAKQVYNYRRNITSVSHLHKAGLAYEVLYNKYRILSVPVSEISKYMHDIISIRLNGLTGVAFSEPKSICDKSHPFLAQIMDDIRRTGYKMNLQEWLLLNIRSTWMYRVFSFMVMVKNFLRYRLGLDN